MLENIKNNKKIDFYKIMNVILAISAVSGLILPWFILSKSSGSNESNLAVSLSSMASFLRFFTGSKNQMVVDIAVHNFAIAILGFILSFLSHGVLGCIFLFLNSFVMGTVLYGVHTFYTILFVFLELLGICIAVFGGTNLAKKRNKSNLSLTVIFKNSIILICIMAVIYFLAAFIESGLIISKWR